MERFKMFSKNFQAESIFNVTAPKKEILELGDGTPAMCFVAYLQPEISDKKFQSIQQAEVFLSALFINLI